MNTKTLLKHLTILIISLFISNCSPKLKFDSTKPMIFGRITIHPLSPYKKNFKITKIENCEIVYGPRTGMAYNSAKIYRQGIFFINLEENLKIEHINCFPKYPNKTPVFSFVNLADIFDYNKITKNNDRKHIYIGDFDIVSTKGYFVHQKNMDYAIGMTGAHYSENNITTEDRFVDSYKEAKSILKEKFNLSLSDDDFVKDKNH